jgi:anti-anti-sigma regulatory factor
MAVHPGPQGLRPSMALNLELSHGRPGASARVELHERHAGEGLGATGARMARVSLRGVIDEVAAGRLVRALEDLALRDLDQVLLDCGELRHIDFRRLPDLVAALTRLDARSGGVTLCGLSRYLRDLFRLAGCDGRLRCWSSADDLLETVPRALEPGRERTS